MRGIPNESTQLSNIAPLAALILQLDAIGSLFFTSSHLREYYFEVDANHDPWPGLTSNNLGLIFSHTKC